MMSEATTIGASQNKKRGMIIPFEQNFITFDEITYSINMPQVSHENCHISLEMGKFC